MEKVEQKEQKKKKPYKAPEVKSIAMETSGMITTLNM